MEIVKFLHTDDNATKVLSAAAHHGHLKIVQWLVENRSKSLDGVNAISAAALNGHIHIMAYLAEYWTPDSQHYSAQSVVECGYFGLLEWLFHSGVISVNADVNDEIRQGAGIRREMTW